MEDLAQTVMRLHSSVGDQENHKVRKLEALEVAEVLL